MVCEFGFVISSPSGRSVQARPDPPSFHTFIDCNVANDEYSISGYSVELRNRNRHGGGVLIYVKEGIKYTKITSCIDTLDKSVWVKIHVTDELLAMGVMHRPPSANVAYMTTILLDQLDEIYSNFDNVILLGDQNYNYVFGDCSAPNPLYQLDTLYNMKQLVEVPTRVTIHSSKLLDVIFSTNHLSHKVSGTYQTSGHAKQEKILKFRNYIEFYSACFLNDLLSFNIIRDVCWPSNLLEIKWNEFKNVFLKVSNEHAPFHCRKLKSRPNPWFDRDIVAMAYQRDYFKRKAISCNDRTVWQSYKSMRNIVTRNIRHKKKSLVN